MKLKLDAAHTTPDVESISAGYLQIISSPEKDTTSREDYLHNARFLSKIFDKLPVGLEIYDKNGGFIESNSKNSEIFGYNQTEIKGVNLFMNPNFPKKVHYLARMMRKRRV